MVPIFHAVLKKYIKVKESAMFINIGGISNITKIANSGQLIAFDTGPANAPLNASPAPVVSTSLYNVSIDKSRKCSQSDS